MPFPLVDLRKGHNDAWQQVVTTESITVPNTAPYIVRLNEIPDNGNENERPSITGLTRTSTYPPATGNFYVNYRTGTLVFNAAQKGLTYNVVYWKIGSIIQCSDINYLYDRLPRRSTFSKTTGLAVDASSSQNFNIDDFGNYGLIYKFQVSQLTGNSSGPYTVEFYDSTAFSTLLYKLENIIPSEDDPFIDRLPVMLEDINLNNQLHCKIINDGLENATYSISIIYMRFYSI
jgi:hypothetical protein